MDEILLGCYFGDPKKVKVWINGIRKHQLAAVDCKDEGKLAQALLELLFTKTELSIGNATTPRRNNITKLDAVRLNAIRGM